MWYWNENRCGHGQLHVSLIHICSPIGSKVYLFFVSSGALIYEHSKYVDMEGIVASSLSITTHRCFIFQLDMDECVEDTYDCDVNAVCENNIGSYFCECAEGWTGNGTICTGYVSVLLYLSLPTINTD